MNTEMVALPLFIIIAGAYLTFVAGMAERPPRRGSGAGILATLVLGTSLILQIILALDVWENGPLVYTLAWGVPSFSIHLEANGLGLLISIVGTLLASLISLYSIGYMSHDSRIEYYYPLLLLMTAGIVGVGFSRDIFNIYLFFELMAISSYALVAFRKDQPDPVEAGFKYLVMSATGTALGLYGISILFRHTGSLDLNQIAITVSEMNGVSAPLVSAAAFIIVGFGVKAAMVPLHTWLPDAHAAAPSGISAMLSGIVIQTGLFTLLRIILTMISMDIPFGLSLAVFAVLTMTTGNVLAFVQKDIKRMLAFSSIAQMGYILLGIGIGLQYDVAGEAARLGLTGGLFHILTHAFMKGLAFICAGAFIHALGTRNINDMRGIGHKMPIVSIAFTISLLALAGAPPFSGFMSEWMIFSAGLQAMPSIGWWGMFFAVAAVANGLLSLGYYLPTIMNLFLGGGSQEVRKAKDVGATMAVPMFIMVLITIVLGIWPSLGLRLVEPAVEFIISMMVMMGGV
ncbi:MAG TPA: hypothetical protein ENN76_03420 [Euryarchaeota archaeon]|nr:hypothetical protein [Euryarchaeota archaeon]